MINLSYVGQLLVSEAWNGAIIDILIATYLIIHYASRRLLRSSFKAQGRLLLQVEMKGKVYAHIGILTAEEREGKSEYEWNMSQINQEDFPYFAMMDLPFTHIRVKQRKNGENLLTISVEERTKSFWKQKFYWIKDATIGNRPGFPRILLLPHNLVLRYFDENM